MMRKISVAMLLLACGLAVAQTMTNPVESAKSSVVEKMEADWGSTVNAKWGENRTSTSGDEVTVFGYGIAHRKTDGLDAVFLYEVRMYTVRRLAPRVEYTVLRWSNSPINDSFLFSASKQVISQRMRIELRRAPKIDFAEPKFSNLSSSVRSVEGSATFSSGGLTGTLNYSVRFSRVTGEIVSVSLTGAPSNPGSGWGGYNAYTEGIAQAHAVEYVRSREGFQVQVQFTGPVTHTLVAKGVDRVAGRGQWRRGSSFAWSDFRYDVQVSTENGKVVSASVVLAPDSHGTPEDQKFIGFAQAAVRREFRFQSSAEVTFLSASTHALPFGKTSIRGEFSAGGKRYAYDVVIEVANGRTERVTINKR